MKLATLERGAAELGLDDWTCPAIADVYGPQTL